MRILREFTHFFALLLWCATALAFFADWQAPGENMAPLGWAIVFARLGADQKMRSVEALKRKGQIVAVTGGWGERCAGPQKSRYRHRHDSAR